MKGGFTTPYKDLRSFLGVLEKEGEITHIPVEVDWKYEMGAITRSALDVLGEKNKAFLYEKPKGCEIPIIANVVGNRKIFYNALDMSPDTFNLSGLKSPLLAAKRFFSLGG